MDEEAKRRFDAIYQLWAASRGSQLARVRYKRFVALAIWAIQFTLLWLLLAYNYLLIGHAWALAAFCLTALALSFAHVFLEDAFPRTQRLDTELVAHYEGLLRALSESGVSPRLQSRFDQLHRFVDLPAWFPRPVSAAATLSIVVSLLLIILSLALYARFVGPPPLPFSSSLI